MIRTITTIFLITCIGILFMSETWADQSQDDLPRILKESARYCKRLANVALHLVCKEKIKENIWLPGIGEFTYTYDYQIIKKGENVEEKRILLEENGKQKYEENAKLKTRLFWYKNVIFGPLGILSDAAQKMHKYKIKKETEIDGEKVIILEVTPKTVDETSGLFGKAWVRSEDCCILKIEWNPTSLKNFEYIQALAKQLKSKPKVTLVTEYGYEKNGIRFPSKYEVTESYMRSNTLEWKSLSAAPIWRIASRTVTTYDEYKFFTVKTDVKYQLNVLK